MKSIRFKKILYYLSIVPSILSLFILSSCTPSLGIFDKQEGNFGFDDYYASFDDIIGFYDDGAVDMHIKEYDIEESITNDYTLEFNDWEDGAEKVEFMQYTYIVIPFKRDLKIEELALFVSSDPNDASNVNLEFSLFYFQNESSCPSRDDLKLYSDPDTKKEGDKDVVIEYGDPKKDYRIAYSTMTVKHEFDSVVFGNFHQTTTGDSYVSDNCLLAKDGGYLYIRVENNSALNRDMTPVKISFINLLVRAI